MKNILTLILLTLLLTSCNEYQKALKSEDVAEKNKVAESLYEQGKYKKALRLYEQIAPAFRGKPSAERMFYFYGKSYYNTNQYILAGYQFDNFVSNYPTSEKREEIAFLAAECYYKESPRFSLDQAATDKALLKLQNYIDNYPESEYTSKANELVKELNEKKEKKAFEIAKQYHDIQDYRYEYNTAIKVMDNFIAEHPGTKYKEAAMFYKLDSAYKLALHSVPQKKEERFLAAKSNYKSLLKYNPNTEFKAKADEISVSIENELQKLSNIN